MLATILAAALALVGFVLLAASAFLGVTMLADWTMDAAQVFLSVSGMHLSRIFSGRLRR